ncbi:MAG TPA: hypothetical protein VGO37_02175 [Steroidobacteraceae bacterium]|nr:hypothetical protein [Steroidobacteraceae bacterium]
MAKAILLLDPDGLALAPATLCAEVAEEARKLNLPMFEEVFATLIADKELRINGAACYEIYEAGQRVAVLEVLDCPLLDS